MSEADARPDPWRAWLRGRERRALHFPEFRRAAVLVALTREAEPRVLLTVRASNLSTHAGQIAFPGGRLDEGEEVVRAALREAWEEVGLRPDDVEVIGELDDAFTPIGFHVTPILARIPPRYEFHPNEEVVQVLLPSVNELRALKAIREVRATPNGERHVLYRYPWRGHDIWGMTARILHDLLESGVT
ncbi:NUDIX hydrolase [Deinococcus yavapaiensis]|uniref:NUDIX domain-containing protein n=1 Tax=Deinococcus yavapaiensis KR-236 TaxID=694435 RepID=A0A318SC44_9DEIO|nr:CoA pyrophosphatase [Deinococcus yavapaiensis]PYE56401.1 NUDIX domain-containing protein [Deinococcus yavapaiensis KR-236]